MKTRLLAIITLCIFLSLIIFLVFIYLIHWVWVGNYIGGGSIDLDPELSPSYAYDYQGYLKFNSIFVIGPILLGIILLVFLVPNIILRTKKIPTRKYMFITTAAVLFFFGSSWISSGLQSILTLEQLEQENDWIRLIGALVQFSMGTVFIVPGIIALKKAKVRIRK